MSILKASAKVLQKTDMENTHSVVFHIPLIGYKNNTYHKCVKRRTTFVVVKIHRMWYSTEQRK